MKKNLPTAADGSTVEWGSAVDPTSGKTYYFSIRASALRFAAPPIAPCAPALRFRRPHRRPAREVDRALTLVYLYT